MVARTMLFGLFDPMHFVSTLASPASSTTARTPPPAMTPVPSDAGLSSTSPAPNRPVTSNGMVPSTSGTSTMSFLAFSMPLRMASGTSFALPSPKPTRPALSPTTTSALKLKRRPPLTTFATRLMWTTFSFSSVPRSSTMRLGLLGPDCAMSRLPSELEAALARAVRHCAHAAVIEEAIAVEHHARDALLLAAARSEQPDLLGRAHVGGLRQLRPQLGGERRHRQERATGLVRDHLHVDVPVAAIDRQARAIVGAAQAAADTVAAAAARLESRDRHQRAPAAALPAFRRTVSVEYLTPLPLYGSGRRRRPVGPARCPALSRSPPSSVTTTCRSTLAVTPGGSW